MKPEIVERLAIDRALGELNEDAAALFDMYLAEHPEAQERARRMSDTCTQTRRAIDRRTQEADIRSPSSRIRPHWVHWTRAGRVAALVAISLGIGVTVGRWSQSSAPALGHAVVRAEPVASASDGWQQVLSSQGQGFWQSKALALLQTTPYTAAGSYASQTNLWGKYKQIRKEWSYE